MADTISDEQKAQLAGAYGAAWLERVERLPPEFHAVAADAGLARLAGDDEATWTANAQHTYGPEAFAIAFPHEEHADARSRFEQGVLVLRDEGLWPWALTPGAPGDTPRG